MASLVLHDRAVVRIEGADAEKLLHDVVTPDIKHLEPGQAVPGALLTPQGKIMFDFLVSRSAETTFLFDLRAEDVDAFIKRMMLYRLRAKAEIAPASDLAVVASWEGANGEDDLIDRRFAGDTVVYRRYGANDVAEGTSLADYRRLRIENGVAELGADFEPSDVFPHDILLDRNGGVSFKKGCFVGQEVVSRMQHRGTARRRVAIVAAETALPATGTVIHAAGKPAGTLGTVEDDKGLAIVRTDRIGAALTAGERIEADGTGVSLTLPPWSGLTFDPDVKEA